MVVAGSVVEKWGALCKNVRPRGSQRLFRPELTAVEERVLMTTAPALALAPSALMTHTRTNPLAVYRMFVATVERGPDAGLTLRGPLVLGYSGRIQVIGSLYPDSGGRPYTVVGTVYGGGAFLRLVIPKAHAVQALELVGSGQLQGVRGGLPDGMSLIGSGNLSGPLKGDVGHWATFAP